MHPLAWIAWAASAALVTMSTINPFYLVCVLTSAWAVHAAHRSVGPHARSFRVFVAFGGVAMTTRTLLVLLVPGDLSSSSLVLALVEGFRLAVLLAVFGAFNSVADPFAVLRLAPRRFHEPALAAALALSIAPRTMASVMRVREAQRMRGLSVGRLRALPALAVPVLETGMEEAVTLAESMDARGHGRGRRTRYRPQTLGRGAITTAVTAVVSAGAFTVAALVGGADLSISTFPLTWPDVAPHLVVAALALATPAFIPVGQP
ncbi:MAG: hypothetical protein M3N53_11390 [Actinomycetota bacterium]|nr:hypothetical protein [Actinomycetota bacterium]